METIPGSSSSPDEELCLFKDKELPAPPLEIRENIFGFEVIDVDGWIFLKNSVVGCKTDKRLTHIAGVVSCAEKLAQALETRGATHEIPIHILNEAIAEVGTELTDSRTLFWAMLVLKKHWKYGEILYDIYSQ